MASAASVVSVAAVPAVALPAVSVSAPPPVRAEDRPAGVGDRLTVIVRHAGAGRNGTYVVSCHPAVGSHPDVAGACRAVDRSTRWGREAFAPVAPGSVCTMVYGGPATAHVTGTWAGRPVDATYDRSNGCEIARWNRMVPLLPDIRS
ncbi:subtilase-type protease inhibitor [Streptomyces sp. HUAS TT20]|uniref:subtilase-type protease inhibitor n=1 Tax=Streptomyces sp. HUAS TT20 TaxID=3447509 RepID=UPI0021DAAB07|nr:subtilase-type protease inhibitor [Streptomyces sp. HUAS 15-9]UXY28583.1 subtilase-type protease inhibitor [Streptomyces sp. HUAS 15-9]